MTQQSDDAGDGSSSDQGRLTLQAVGITLLGVLASIGVTVALGVTAAWWLRIVADAATTVGLALSVALLGTRTNLLTRLADWITGRSYRESRRDGAQ
jgi:hypothetical protein